MLAYLPLYFLIWAMVWEKIRLDKKAQQDYEKWQDEFWNKH